MGNKKFLMLDKNLRTRGLTLAKERLKLRFKGIGGAKVDLISNDASLKSAYRNLKNAMGLINTNDEFSISDVERPL